MLIKLGAPAGEKMEAQPPGCPPGVGAVNGFVFFIACGVISIGSSLSSGSIASPSSELLLESASSMFTLPNELEGAVRSPLLMPHIPCPTLGESMSMELARVFLGIIMPFCVIVGDESGDGWSASVE
jgi:hypothetical protein